MKIGMSFYIIYVFLFILIIWTTGVDHQTEGFVPRINRLYKPQLRKIKSFLTDKIETLQKNLNIYVKRLSLA